ncbi:hypothetical protein CNMCM5878_007659 [Aspergillus fumigatiaffinis]|nr:hypothetical protein CNMCM5878_007659 [Aspergillus fumigatiaffinis]
MPVVFCSHGTPLMAQDESESSDWWRKFGQEAIESGDVKGVVYINSHWIEMDDKIRVGTRTNPDIFLPLVRKEKYENYPINIDQGLAQRVIDLLKSAGLPDVEGDPTAHWEDAPTTPSLWMFPQGSLPSTTVSLNGRYDPVFHVRMGRALRPLREQGILIIGSGATVHNIFRANWIPAVLSMDHFQIGTTPAKWAADFDQSIYDLVEGTTGSRLAGALVRLTESPYYVDCHPSNDHYFPLLVLAGTLYEDEEVYGRRKARTFELKNLVNSQYMWGEFPSKKR